MKGRPLPRPLSSAATHETEGAAAILAQRGDGTVNVEAVLNEHEGGVVGGEGADLRQLACEVQRLGQHLSRVQACDAAAVGCGNVVRVQLMEG